jgi:integrase
MAKKARRKGKNVGCLVLRGKTWFARWVVGKETFTRTTGTGNKEAAEAKLKEFTAPFRLGGEEKTLETMTARLGGVKAEIAKHEDEKPATTIRDCWQTYIDQHNRPDSGPVTLSQYEGWYDAFSKWYEENYPKTDKDCKLVSEELRRVTQEQADRYAGHLMKLVSATTFNRHMNALALVWRVLTKRARLSFNPWKAIGRKRFSVHSRRELTIKELGDVFNKAQGEMRLLLALGTFCGLRLGDAACLDWGCVDMVRGIISLVPQKTARRSQKRVTLPIHRTLYAMLEAIPKAMRHGYVMPAMAARHQSFNAALAKDVANLFLSVDIKTNPNAVTATEKAAFKAAMKKAKDEGTEPPKAKPKGPRARADCGFHSLRHTFVSLCAAGGVPQSVVQSLVGHGSPAMTQHYTHIGIETAQKAVALLPDVTKEPEQVTAASEKVPVSTAAVDIAALVTTLTKMTPKTWKADRDKLVALLGAPPASA